MPGVYRSLLTAMEMLRACIPGEFGLVSIRTAFFEYFGVTVQVVGCARARQLFPAERASATTACLVNTEDTRVAGHGHCGIRVLEGLHSERRAGGRLANDGSPSRLSRHERERDQVPISLPKQVRTGAPIRAGAELAIRC